MKQVPETFPEMCIRDSSLSDGDASDEEAGACQILAAVSPW